MSPSDDSIWVQAPLSQDVGARAMKAQVASSLFGEAATPITIGRYEITETIGTGGMGVVHAAWDDALGRRVAIKVLSADLLGSELERARLVREAQALAKLSHPNVVHVYEVGEHDGGVFVVMELVQGSSLREWHGQQARSVEEQVEAFIQAGRGLAAAHRAGLVHRDFKPANALMGMDGRVRVVDFGLAQGPGLTAGSTSTTGQRLRASPTGVVTRAGALVGTPAYMAPEQLSREGADARSDQFSLCVALYEAVVGCRPFERVALAMASELPVLAPTKGPRRLPWLLRRALHRGLAIEPARRWPDMEALLEALESSLRWRRRGRTWIGPLALSAAAVLWLKDGAPPACDVPEHGPVAEWTEARQRVVRGAMLATEVSFAEDAWLQARRRLGGHAERWAALYVSACRSDEPSRRDRIMGCLDGEARRFSAVVASLAEVDASSIDRVGEVLAALGDPQGCLSMSDVAPPLSSQVIAGLAQAEVLVARGAYAQAGEAIEELIGSGGGADVAPAEALLLRGRVLWRLESFEPAQAAFAAAAERAGPGTIRARALLAQLELLIDREHWSSAEDLSPWVEAAIDVAGSPDSLVADHLDALGRLRLDGDDDPAAAATLHRRALALRDGTATTDTRLRVANALAREGSTDEALAQYRQVLAQREHEVGRAHPAYASVLFDLGLTRLEAGLLDAARSDLSRALEIERAAYGEDSAVAARTEVKLAEALGEHDEPDEALAHAEAAWRVLLRLPQTHSDREAALRALAVAEFAAERHSDSLEHHLQIAREYGTQGAPDVLQNIAWLSCQVGRCTKARPWLERMRDELASLQAQPLPEPAQLQLRILALYGDQVGALIAEAEGDHDGALQMLGRLDADAHRLSIPPDDGLTLKHRRTLLDEVASVAERIRAGRRPG